MVSIHSYSVPLLWVCNKAEHHDMEQSKAKVEREREREIRER
jgi:hypothetical protein